MKCDGHENVPHRPPATVRVTYEGTQLLCSEIHHQVVLRSHFPWAAAGSKLSRGGLLKTGKVLGDKGLLWRLTTAQRIHFPGETSLDYTTVYNVSTNLPSVSRSPNVRFSLQSDDFPHPPAPSSFFSHLGVSVVQSLHVQSIFISASQKILANTWEKSGRT